MGPMLHSGMPALPRLFGGTFSGLRLTFKPVKLLQGVCFQELQRSKGRMGWRVAPGVNRLPAGGAPQVVGGSQNLRG